MSQITSSQPVFSRRQLAELKSWRRCVNQAAVSTVPGFGWDGPNQHLFVPHPNKKDTVRFRLNWETLTVEFKSLTSDEWVSDEDLGMRTMVIWQEYHDDEIGKWDLKRHTAELLDLPIQPKPIVLGRA